MTREKEIQEKAKELGQIYFPDEYNIWARENIEAKCVESAFIEGAKWADEHPKNGIVSIDNVCECLKSLTYQDYEGAPFEQFVDDYIIDMFRKAMEKKYGDKSNTFLY